MQPGKFLTLSHHRRKCEYEYLIRLLKYTRGNVLQACKISNVPRMSFYRMLKKYKIELRDPLMFGEAPIKGPQGWTIIYRDKPAHERPLNRYEHGTAS